jgi:hypothetical protein
MRIAARCGLKSYLSSVKSAEKDIDAALMAAVDDKNISDMSLISLIQESEARMVAKQEQLETRVDSKLTVVKDSITALNQEVPESGLGIKAILQKMNAAPAPEAPVAERVRRVTFRADHFLEKNVFLLKPAHFLR